MRVNGSIAQMLNAMTTGLTSLDRNSRKSNSELVHVKYGLPADDSM